MNDRKNWLQSELKLAFGYYPPKTQIEIISEPTDGGNPVVFKVGHVQYIYDGWKIRMDSYTYDDYGQFHKRNAVMPQIVESPFDIIRHYADYRTSSLLEGAVW